jgi:hypothetical protein
MSKTLTLATAAALFAAATSLASAGIIMPAKSIGASGMHAPPSDRLSFGSSIRTQGGVIDPNERKSTPAVDAASGSSPKGHRKSRAGYDFKVNKKI